MAHHEIKQVLSQNHNNPPNFPVLIQPLALHSQYLVAQWTNSTTGPMSTVSEKEMDIEVKFSSILWNPKYIKVFVLAPKHLQAVNFNRSLLQGLSAKLRPSFRT